MTPRRVLAACALLFWLGQNLALGLDFQRLQQQLQARFNGAGQAIFSDWQQMLGSARKSTESERIRQVNDFFNQRLAFDDDFSVWGQTDYWATPLEGMAQARGDCEDFTIAKYFSLLALDIPVSKLRLVYVRANLPAVDGGVTQQAHMVLAYYPSPNADPLVLDNLNKQILPASRRGDLTPVFSFNSAGLWRGTGNQTSQSNLSRWQDLLNRARSEGFQ